MKTKRIKMDNGETITAKIDNSDIRHAIQMLLFRTGGDLVLMVEATAKPKVFLLVGYNPKTHLIEYQLSDGMEGHRTHSYDFYNIQDAIKAFREICEKGWTKLK